MHKEIVSIRLWRDGQVRETFMLSLDWIALSTVLVQIFLDLKSYNMTQEKLECSLDKIFTHNCDFSSDMKEVNKSEELN